MTITDTIHDAVTRIPRRGRLARGDHRHARPERLASGDAAPRPRRTPPPLRFTDADGNRLTCFATHTPGGELTDLELRHRRRARCEDRIRTARDTGLTNLPLHSTAQNQIWLEIVQLALDLLAWMPMLALDGDARRWEIKKLRLRSSCGCTTRTGCINNLRSHQVGSAAAPCFRTSVHTGSQHG